MRLSKYPEKKQSQFLNSKSRETDKPRRKGLCTTSSIQSNLPLPFSTPTETFPITFVNNNNNSKLTSRTRVIFPTRNLSKWSQIVNNGTFAHSISNLLQKTKNKLSLKELSPSGQIHFVNMMNRDLTLMQTIELYTALTPHKFTLAYRLKFTVLPNGVYINFSMSQSQSGSSAMVSEGNETNGGQSVVANSTSSAPLSNVNNNQNSTNSLSISESISTNNQQQQQQHSNNSASTQSVTRHGWALFQISREKDSNNSVLPNKIIEVAILM